MTGRLDVARRLCAGAACAVFVAVAVAGLEGTAQGPSAQKPAQTAKKDPIAKASEPWPAPSELENRRAAAEGLPLFQSQEPLAFTLTSDFQAINRDRDPESTKQFPGTLRLVGASGDPIPVGVGARGHVRRNRRVCEVVPIRLDFKKKDVAGTVFDGQGALKLVTHCEDSDEGEQRVLTEYLAYRILNLFTPRSFRARLVRVTYVDPKRAAAAVPRYGMLIENDDDVARRSQGRTYSIPKRVFSTLEPQALLLMTMFQFMIANTDYSIMALHNVKLVQGTEALYPVPYDFDYSGLVNTGYGTPDKQFNLRSVRERLYLGPCKTMAEYGPVLQAFSAKKDDVLGLIDQVPDMKPARRVDARNFLEGFFTIASDPAKAKRAFVDQCRKVVGM